jgi:pimeloyl-ACP methyl ester carboxylesterase
MKRFIPFLLLALASTAAAETLPALVDGEAPQTFDEMWAGFDPQAEPIDVEILKEWEEDGVVIRVLRYRVGVFKGQKAMMAAVYGFPKGGSKLPGLVQIHGGGQYADSNAVLTNARRGYATISIAWAGRISSPEYRVSPKEVKLFWDGKTDDPAYRITTDWGALDAYHAPSRNGKDAFATIRDGSEPWTLDDVESPRNSSWFLCTLAARRALTFLEQQPEVDASRLGVYGHSMGGKLTVATAASDERVKAAAPSCGGTSDRYNANPLHPDTIGDAAALKQIDCPIIFLSPANDFHGHINHLVEAVSEIAESGEVDWRVTCSAHLNHQDHAENEVATQLWFDQHLKGNFTWPATPEASLQLKTEDGTSRLTVRADASRKIVGVEVYYTQQGLVGKEHHHNRINQFWHFASCKKDATGDSVWTARLPLFGTDQPLWVYANVIYTLDQPVSGAGYYYGNYTTGTFNLSSLIQIIEPQALQEADVEATLTPSQLIESFESDDWSKEWFSYKPEEWTIRTHKVYHPMWQAPQGAATSLSLEVLSAEPNKLVLGIDGHAAEIELKGSLDWQTVKLSPSDLKDASGEGREDWEELKELRVLAKDNLRGGTRDEPVTRAVGAAWKGAPPKFRNLRWMK